MKKPRAYYASDYAGLKTEHASFYYGYEETFDGEWCFVAKFGAENIKIPFSKLGGKDEWACVENLLLGIGWLLVKQCLSLNLPEVEQ